MPSILFFSFPYASSRGGGERYTEQTVEGLLRAGGDVTLVSSSEALLSAFVSKKWKVVPLWLGVEPVTAWSAAIFPLFAIVAWPILFFLLAWFRWAKGVRTIVCLSMIDKLLATPIARLFGLRVVWMEHLVAGRSLRLNPFRGLYVALSKRVRIVTVSEAAAASYAQLGVPRDRIAVISPGVASLAAQPPRRAGHVIGAISRFSREKNVALLLKAFAEVLKSIPDATLEIYGDGPERAALKKLAQDLGITEQAHFHGYVERIGDRCAFDVLAVPSSRESFGMAALETMRCGIPVVATRAGGLPEVIADGETGIVVPPDDAAAMSEALVALMKDPARAAHLGAAGRERAARMFSEEKMQQAWTTLLS